MEGKCNMHLSEIWHSKKKRLSHIPNSGYEFNNVVIDARYNFGVTNIADGGDAKNSVFQFTLGYKFAL